MKQVLGVIGYPIKHSLSPQMHNAAFEALELEMTYHAFEVSPDRLQEAIIGLKGLGLRGLNVTIPHKVNVIPFLDEIDELAKEIGAVNTIVNYNGILKGYNTDGEGFLHSLLGFISGNLKEMSVLIIGAGGAAKAVALTMAKHGLKHITIANRTLSKGEELAASCGNYAPSSSVSILDGEKMINQFDIIINTTSIGMINKDEIPISLDRLRNNGNVFICDLIYTPMETRFLQEGQKRGAKVMNGLGMFINQGAIAFEHWTGQKAPVPIMKETVVKHLEGGS
ncbi:MAG: shikimate dehydrogenase [Bacillus sp. (in: Bacteria)]|nr:shikimate dehydrogenase [Bacillus sp. (in: firmicutes)]